MDTKFFMNYAEGKSIPAIKYNDEKEAIKDAERLAETLGVEVTTFESVTKTVPTDITRLVKTCDDACAVLGIEPDDDEVLTKSGFTKDEIAYRKLKIVIKALNEGWEPDWGNRNEYKHWPLFYVDNGAPAGFAASPTYADLGSRLCFKSRELAEYAGTQFLDLWKGFIL
jgi:hypothetical protein